MPIRKTPALEITNPRAKRVKKKEDAVPVRIQLPDAHPRQYELINAFELYPEKNIRFVVGACGTKFGKTFGCVTRLIKEAWENKGTLNWWVAPVYGQSKMAYYTTKRMLPKGSYQEYKADLRLVLLEPDGSEHSVIEFKSADNEDSLRGYAVDFFIIDEAARIKYESFVSIQTTTTQTMGRGIIISTPKGRGWFYDVYQWGEKFDNGRPRFGPLNPDPYPEFMSIRMPTWTNPHVRVESIRQAKKNLPEDVFRQEFGARFIDDSAGVFRKVSSCIKGHTFEYPHYGHRYVLGVDLARLHDFTVLTVMDADRKHVVYMERFNHVEWEIQYSRIVNLARRYNNAIVSIDWTGIGDPIVETLTNAGLRMEPYKISTGLAKQQLIEKLRVNIENGVVSFPETVETIVMLEELRAYEYTFTKSGNMVFSAPSGKHDDCVISLALANWIGDSTPYTYRAWNQRGV
jgi:hypothetical protein